MRMLSLLSSMGLLAAAVVGIHAAKAATFSNYASFDGGGPTGSFIWEFGTPDTTSYGEVFTAPSGAAVLNSFGFLIDTERTLGNAKFVLAKWDGSKAVGPAIFTSTDFALDSPLGYHWHTVNAIDAVLTPGDEYVGYFTVAGVTDPVPQGAAFGTTNDSGGLPGILVYQNSNGADPLTLSTPWRTYADYAVQRPNLVYTATFGTAPIPATLVLFGSALAILGFIGWRRNQTAAV
jgi:hypothetical protein